MANLLDLFEEYTEGTESTPQNIRWSFLSAAAACLGRRVYLPFGHQTIYPNLYVFLVGAPATRKSSAIKIAQKLIADAGYTKFAFERTSREKFLMDFEEGFENLDSMGKFDVMKALDTEMAPTESTVRECYICADEFVEFIGMKNYSFLNLLTKLFDNHSNYPERLKNSKSVMIPNPTINILGGLTPASLSLVLPPEMVGQGLTSRLLLIDCGKIPKKITFPNAPDILIGKELIEGMQRLMNLKGEVKISGPSRKLLDRIYQTYPPLPDARLQHYCSRRFSHLLKLCVIFSALRGTLIITDEIVEQANTILSYTEATMHLALGEFGDAKNSAAMQKVMEVLKEANEPLGPLELWEAVSTDLSRFSALNEILMNLLGAKKILQVTHEDESKFLINRAVNSRQLTAVNFEKWIPEFSRVAKDIDLV